MFSPQQTRPKGLPDSTGNDVAALILDERGMIRDCNKSVERLVGYLRSKLVWHHVSLLVPQLDESVMIRNNQINPKISYLCHCGHKFVVQDREGQTFHSEMRLFELSNPGRRIFRLILCQ